ncbi:MAG: hypothetical protein GX051_09250 [Clostridiales bacterium]|nr:hypothetical protein [Clostridiales bacterium]
MNIPVVINREEKHQIFDRFGTSAAWWAQVVGGWEHIDAESGKPVRERIAQLLFNRQSGIGIATYRYNLGGGSGNHDECPFGNPSRTAESFDISETEYDFSRDKNAVYMMREAVKNGCDEVIMFSNSPPERFTKNHKAFLDRAWHTNLKKENYPKFAKYVLDVAEHFIAEGIPVKYISPVNEPVWVWTQKHGQEGCHYNPGGVRGVMREFARQMKNRDALAGVRLSGAENGDIRWFNKTYTRIMLSDPLIRESAGAVDIHSYFLPLPIPFINNRLSYIRRYRRYLDRKYPDARVNISEWTHMKGGRDYGMDSALEQAKVITEDISLLNAASWQLWIAVSNVDYCDGLIYINDDKSFELTKRYYAFGNYSKFIPQGARRIGISSDDKDLLLLAFESESRIIVTSINLSYDEKVLCFSGINAEIATLTVTDSQSNLEEKTGFSPDNAILTPRSVNTIIFNVKE